MRTCSQNEIYRASAVSLRSSPTIKKQMSKYMCKVDIESQKTISDIIKESPTPFLILCAFVRILRDASEDSKDALNLMRSINTSLEKHSIKWDNIRQALTDCDDQARLYATVFKHGRMTRFELGSSQLYWHSALLYWVQTTLFGTGGDGVWQFVANDSDDANCHTWIIHRVRTQYRIVQSNITKFDIGQFCFGWSVNRLNQRVVQAWRRIGMPYSTRTFVHRSQVLTFIKELQTQAMISNSIWDDIVYVEVYRWDSAVDSLIEKKPDKPSFTLKKSKVKKSKLKYDNKRPSFKR